MKLGLHIADFTWEGGPAALRQQLGDVAARAEQAGYDRISVMDHVWQIGGLGPPEHEMLEAYTCWATWPRRPSGSSCSPWSPQSCTASLGSWPKPSPRWTSSPVAARCSASGRPGTRRSPADSAVLPSTAERFERLEEALQICKQMWSDADGPYEGRHYRLERTLNSPQALSLPHPPILIGGAGERKTLRLVAQYADACNIFDTPELAHKLQVLRDHCERLGRDYDEIEKTAQLRFDLGPRGERVEQTIEHLHNLADLGIEVAHGTLANVSRPGTLDLMAERVIPAAAALAKPGVDLKST